MQVPLLDLKAQYSRLREQIIPRVVDVLDSQFLVNGPAVRELEAQVAAASGCVEGVGTSSGTDALLLALMAMGIGQGDEVITTPYTFFATAGSIWRVGARPVFVDIDPVTFNLDASAVEAAVTDRTRAIMPVHLFGQMADMNTIMDVARRRDLKVIEDAAQAITAEFQGQRAGAMGTAGCFSFYPSKNLAGAGDGGMVVTQDADLAEHMRTLRNHGDSGQPRYFHREVGGNFRLDTLQAVYLQVKLGHLGEWNAARRENAALYDRLLADVDEVVVPAILDGNVSTFNQYVIRVPRRDELQAFLGEQGVGSAVYYPLGLHQQECFQELGYAAGDFPETERATRESLALPIFPELTEEQIGYVAEQIKAFFDRSS
ncbi:MAG: DegT/DnrJ/EryC1/StrS family aminotransferase [Phycisphaerae bacterium]|nr:DegT/DnrJ/EryC1/StrS family aminotransferase [Phycisphaerae bacterium]